MLTFDIFDDRVDALWKSQKGMAAPRKWKSGKRAGTLRTGGFLIQFTREELARWLWKRVGLNAIQCPYCHAPIDILSLTLDHIVPRSIGGEFSLANMEPICHDCNERKGPLTHEGFVMLLDFSRDRLSPYDHDILLARLKAAHHGSSQRFFRPKKGGKEAAPTTHRPPPASKPAQQKPIDFW